MYNIYAIVIVILFDIPRFSVNDLHQIQVAGSMLYVNHQYNAVQFSPCFQFRVPGTVCIALPMERVSATGANLDTL